MYAARYGRNSVVQMLVDHPFIEVNLQNKVRKNIAIVVNW